LASKFSRGFRQDSVRVVLEVEQFCEVIVSRWK